VTTSFVTAHHCGETSALPGEPALFGRPCRYEVKGAFRVGPLEWRFNTFSSTTREPMVMHPPACLLHVGVPKTGSTALQRFLTDHSGALADAGWIYPDVSRRGWGHHDLAFLLGDGYPEWASRQPRMLHQLLADLAVIGRQTRRIILSSENFYLFADPICTREALAAIGFSPTAVRVVAYLRRQDEMHISWYNQAIKAQGYSGTLAQSIEETFGMWNYADRLAAWREAFGDGSLVIRPYPPGRSDSASHEFDVRRDFLQLAGIEPEAFRFDAVDGNPRLNRDLLEFQRVLNLLPLPTSSKRAYHQELKKLATLASDSDLFDDSPLLDASARRALLERYAEGNRELAVRHLGRRDLFPALPLSGLEVMDRRPGEWSGLTPEKVASIVGWLLASKVAGKEPT